MAAYELEECWQLLRQSLHSVSYETLAHLPSYSKWLSHQDWTPAYRRHRKNLQLIGLNDVDKRWVLKNPSHLFALDALMATYPDALVIQTHRPVETIMASMCSLAQHTADGWSTNFVGAQIGADAMETWSRGLERFNTARAKYDPAQFYDVDYRDLIADPTRDGGRRLPALRYDPDRCGAAGHGGEPRREPDGRTRAQTQVFVG